MSTFARYTKELRELIAGSSTTGPSSVHYEDKLREVLSILLRDHVLPSPTANKRETTVVLKLLDYTARRNPGVFFNGRAAEVIRVIGRIFPFFADPDFGSITFDAVWSLLSLLRTGDREAYRQFFLDSMVAIEDVLYVASKRAEKPCGVLSRCLVKCLCGSFSDILEFPGFFSELPDSCQPKNGPGVLVDLTGDMRWRPFVTSLITLINKCLTDGTLYVEGLVSMQFVSSACSILCYGDESLHKVCFDFARIVATVMKVEILPMETIIRSITCILNQDVDDLSMFRDADYDFSMGACLHALHSSCPACIVESTAVDIVNVFASAMQTSKSSELQAAMCSAYKRIVKVCSPLVWKPEILLKLLYLPKPYDKLIECIRLVVDKFGRSFICVDDNDDQNSFLRKSEGFELPKAGQKRIAQNQENNSSKRQKMSESRFSVGSFITTEFSAGIGYEVANDYAYDFRLSVESHIKFLSPDNHKAYPLEPDIAIQVLSLLCLSFGVNPETGLFIRISKQVLSWIPWICKQATKKCLFSFDISLYLEALHVVMLLQSFHPGDIKLLGNDAQLIGESSADLIHSIYVDLISLVKWVWSDGHVSAEACSDWKLKCLLVQVIATISNRLNAECDLEVLELAMHSETVEVQNEALMSLPIIVLYSGPRMLGVMFRKLESVGTLGLEKVWKSIAFSLGFLSCLNGNTNATDKVGNHCKLFLDKHFRQPVSTSDLLLRGFRCPRCDIRAVHTKEQLSVVDIAVLQDENVDFKLNMSKAHFLFFKFLYADTSKECTISMVEVLPRILRHSSREVLLATKIEWVKCIDFLLLHGLKAVRDAFSGVVSCFLENSVMDILFSDGLGMNGGTKELNFLDKIKHAFTEAEDSHVLLTLLESTATIMKASDTQGEVFFGSFVLLIAQLDNHDHIIKMATSRLLHRCCIYCFEGGIEVFLSKHFRVRDNLYDYLSSRLLTHPRMISEFAEAIIGVKTEELIRRMVPSVIPKLIVSHPNNDQVVITLDELANHLNTGLVPLIVNQLPKVLSFTLFYEDGQHLPSVLQFYHTETGTDTKEIFAAALPALLDEIVCFPGESDQTETDRRTTRISPTIQNIARILTGNDTLPEFLKNDFVRLLNSIDKKMLRSDDTKLQKLALQRIRKLVEMMGPYLSTHAPKIMVLLIFSIDKEALQMDGLDVLHFFIKQLTEVSPTSIKYVMSQVVAAFIPSLERCRECPFAHLSKIVEILEELVLKNSILLKQHIRELPLLPSLPSLSGVNKVIQEARGIMTLQDHLKDAVDGLNHESLNVRYMVACELSKLLKTRREDITALIIGEDVADLDVISALIMTLLKGCAEESRTTVGQRLKLVCADCLGALGAVDPAKFKVISSERFKIECSDDDLIFELIHKHLARAFRAASDTMVQDSAAFAIQELLKLAGCQSLPNEDNGNDPSSCETSKRGQKLWGRFSGYVKEIIAPCLTSRFQLPNVNDAALPSSIYRPTMSFRRWLYYWIRKLTSHATGSRCGIFSACRGIIRYDMPTALYLLPYLVLNVVCYGTPEARQSITEEILSVLNAAASESSEAIVHGITQGQSEVCIQAIFTLLDNLGQWVDDLKQEIALSQPSHVMAGKEAGKSKEENHSHSIYVQDQLLVQCSNVAELLAAIPKVTLAKTSFRCQAYARALTYFESHVREKSGSSNPAAECSGTFSDDDISFLMEIYGGLDEPDGLLGLANLRKSSNLQDQLIINEKAGNWAEVLTLSEQALQMEPDSVHRHCDVLNCFLNMCHLQAMVAHVDGLVYRIPQYKKTWCMQGVQAAWRLGRWDLMDEYLPEADKGLVCSTSENNASFDMGLAKIFKAMMNKDQYMVAEKIAQSKQALLVPLAAAGMDSYMRAYPYVVKLHMLCELEDFNTLLGDESFLDKSFRADDPNFLKLTTDWENRLRCTQSSLWAREPLLAFRRMVYNLSHMNAQVGNCWLQYAKLCRLAGHYETAHHAILEADASGAPNAHMEKAKHLWNIRKSDSAIAELQQTLLNMPAEVLGNAVLSSLCSLSLALPNAPVSATQASKENPDVSKTLLLYTRWIHNTGQKQSEDIKSHYNRVTELRPKWEKGFFCMAKFLDDLLVDARKRQEDKRFTSGVVAVPPSSAGSSKAPAEEKPWWDSLPTVALCYAKGLHKGHKNLFQALPRLLTLWFEFGNIYNQASSDAMKNIHHRMIGIMRGCLKDLPTYQWLTVLSQLISRICHQNAEVVKSVKRIITSVLQAYPQQALWMMAALSKSTVSARRDAAAEILQSAKKSCRRGSDNGALFVQFPSLIEHLIKLCFHPGQPKARAINISTEFSALKRMMPLGIILPVQQALTVTLPSYDSNMSDQSSFHPFSVSEHPTIAGIADDAEILSSLQKPKKVVFLGSDGVPRPFLCKPKDDLRKDARMMEFNAMINRLLSKVPESRRRKLYIRTFAVVPLTEDCGMVEWVPNTRGLRQILQDIYITCGKYDRVKTNAHIKRIYDVCHASKIHEDVMLKTKILPMFPPVFHKWFLMTFSEPAAWFRARVAYAHTTAVWSMVGHIVGLGDRHGENILFDSTTGDCVHVDFSCLFDKGLQLEKPEVVPFRLTQNMIDGLGIAGYEGVFLKVCEITLSVLRTHKEALMTVLETFIHDPLVEWTKSHKSSGVEVRNPHAQRAISNITERLQGVVVGVNAAPSLPLSVEGQARRLIAEAVSHKNLGKMYIWWMPWF
ncbi:serine/threonine-protein kinase ATR [Brachypodium distachyon]|uniref:serine/threonine-protein kinase ATR n=1 Tax=Brachypodium distachyon TaxID=15368 RepID=UPI0006E47502|nr:serine/threonine-protein kinase ATR [Brachypodium distachyon]|eukprot:XP_024312541.1 serine/threonine-protein kinase ATR [Brachypodium distachyon]